MSDLIRRLLGVVLPAALLTVLVPAVGLTTVAAAAPTVACGATLKANATLTKDLSCPTGKGLTLYKGVVLNLGGHKLSGPGTGTGVTLSAKGGSVVTNGTISNWGLGVDEFSDDYYPAPASKISKVTFSKAPLNFSLSIVNITGSTFSRSPINDWQGTITFSSSKLTASQISGFYSQIAITGSTVTGGGVDDGAAQGIVIDRSTMDGTGYTGSPAGCSETGVTITNSTVKNYKQPIGGYYCGVTLTNNTFTNMPGGVLGDVSSGFLEGQPYTFIRNNKFASSGVVLDSGAMVVTGNTFSHNTTGLIARDPRYTTVSGNTFSNNTGSGVRAMGDGLTLKNNKAINNGRYGIHAPNAINQGGNTAYGNTLGQCVGLSCATQ